jgi:hypothetical protein
MATKEPSRIASPFSSRIGLGLLALLFVFLACLGVGGGRCAAHPASIAAATAKVQPDGNFVVQARFDLLAFILDDTPQRIGDGPMNALLDGPVSDLQAHLSDAEGRFQRDFQVSGGSGPGVVDSVVFPSLTDVQKWRDSGIKPRLPVTMTVTVQGHLLPGAASVSFRFPDVLGMIVVTTEFPYREPTSEPVEAGAFSTPLPLTAVLPVTAALPLPPPAAVRAVIAPKPKQMTGDVTIPKAALASKILPLPNPAPPSVKPAPASKPIQVVKFKPTSKAHPLLIVRTVQAVHPSLVMPIKAAPPTPPPTRPLPWLVLVFRYVQMGYMHILPNGLDHILFVLGLFLLSTRLKPLLWQITAFTVAHSLTLALSLYGLVRLPPTIIEPVIAASIAFVAIENLFTTDLKPWRPFVVFGFGLVHGMGFAGALKDLGLQRHDFLTALVGFNMGVELGQLSVVALALLAVGWFRSRPSYRRLVVIPASATIAAVAVFWTFQRLL